MTPYPQYESSDLRWAPDLPAHWQVKQLRHVGAVRSGGTPTADPENWNGDLPFVTPPDLRRHLGREVAETERTVTDQGAAGSSVVPAGSVLVSIRAPIGHVARSAARVAFNQGCRAVIPNGSSDGTYLTYALLAAGAELTARGRGTTFMEVSGGAFSAMKIPQPPLIEQRAIADYLEEELHKIDTLIECQELLIERLRERWVSLITARVSELEGEVYRLRHLFRPSSACNAGDEEVLSVYRDYGVIPKSSRTDNYNRTPDSVDKYLLVQPGDLVVNRMKAWQGSLGVSAYRGIVSPDYEVLRPTTELAEADFMHLYLRSPALVSEYRIRSRGIRPAQWRLYWEQMGDIRVTVPAAAEQQRFVSDLERANDDVRTLIAKSEQFIALSKERRAALITAAVTGQIDVRKAA